MSHKQKATPEEKVSLVQRYLKGEISNAQASKIVGISESCFKLWIKRYEAEGSTAFVPAENNRIYDIELKRQAVADYLSGGGGLLEICKKYRIRSTWQLRSWIKVHNNGKDFNRKMSGGSRMTKARKTTQQERIQIAKECLEAECNYGEIALKYDVSYQQVYTWVKKFSELSESGLEDRRGKRTADQEPRTEIEKLKIQVAKLEHENYMLQMERDLLKKVEDLERRDAFHK
jgi:transposase